MSETARYTCANCGRTYNRHKWQYMKCSCLQVRYQWPDGAVDRVNEEQCIKITDHERMRIRNDPMSETDAESLLGFDALYEDGAAWNRRSRKCTADGVPEECRKRNPEGLWHGMPFIMKDYLVDPADFEYHAPSRMCRKCGDSLRRRAEGDASLCTLCGRKMHRVTARRK